MIRKVLRNSSQNSMRISWKKLCPISKRQVLNCVFQNSIWTPLAGLRSTQQRYENILTIFPWKTFKKNFITLPLQMGLITMFTSKADLSGISSAQKLHVDELVQHVSIKVNEGASSENSLTGLQNAIFAITHILVQ